MDRWIRRHTRERFGPVRHVEPVQVFELGFEGIADLCATGPASPSASRGCCAGARTKSLKTRIRSKTCGQCWRRQNRLRKCTSTLH